MNKFVRTKISTGSKFSKIFLQQLYTGWIVVVHLCFGFCARRLSVERYSYSDVAGWVAGWLAGWLAGCHTPVLYQNG